MRLYLDTNILAFLLNNGEGLSNDVISMIQDYENTLLVCPTVLEEFIHLAQVGRFSSHRRTISASHILSWANETGLQLVPTNERHLSALAALPLHGDHRDPNDRLIIAQAISDRIPLISSDRKFERYKSDGLNFIFNKR